MKKNKSIPAGSKLNLLGQICNFVPEFLVSTRIAREAYVDKMARTFSLWSHVVVVLNSVSLFRCMSTGIQMLNSFQKNNWLKYGVPKWAIKSRNEADKRSMLPRAKADLLAKSDQLNSKSKHRHAFFAGARCSKINLKTWREIALQRMFGGKFTLVTANHFAQLRLMTFPSSVFRS